MSRDSLQLGHISGCNKRTKKATFSAKKFAFTEFKMPKMTGLELTAKILARNKSVPIAVITGHAQVWRGNSRGYGIGCQHRDREAIAAENLDHGCPERPH